MISELTTDQKIGQLFFIGIEGYVLDPNSIDLIQEVSPGGVCLFARNIRERQQTRELTDHIRDYSDLIPLISIDQEGGLVDRLRRLLPPMPAADRFAEPAECREMGKLVGRALRMLGLNMDFAPVVDVTNKVRRSSSNGLYSRMYGSSADEVVMLAGAFLDALEREGVMGCLKHFPGLGASKVDSHEELPRVEIDHEVFEKVDLHPYESLLTSGANRSVMVAHATYPSIHLQEKDQNGKLIPTSLSYNFVTRLLREKLRYEGLVITDDLQMGAIIKNYGIGEACGMAIAAGVDMLAICSDYESIRKGFKAVKESVAAGDLSLERLNESAGRILKLKESVQEPLPFDPAAFESLAGDVISLDQELSRS